MLSAKRVSTLLGALAAEGDALQGQAIEQASGRASDQKSDWASAQPRHRLRYRLRFHDMVPSTNSLVKEALRAGEPEGLAISALAQDAGYGRAGRAWTSPQGGLYFSLLLRPQVPLAQLPTLSQASSLAICEALAAYAPDAREALAIKWPNDVMCAGRKLCGISLERSGDAVCLGVGINVFQPSDARNRQVGGKYVPAYLSELCALPATAQVDASGLSIEQLHCLEDLLAHCLRAIADVHGAWVAQGFPALREDYLQRLSLLGQEIGVENLAGELCVQGTVATVNEVGQLVLRDAQGGYHSVSAGEVHLRAQAALP